MPGDANFFIRSDQVEASWSVLDTILQAWVNRKLVDIPNYSSRTWDPQSADPRYGRMAAAGCSLFPESTHKENQRGGTYVTNTGSVSPKWGRQILPGGWM